MRTAGDTILRAARRLDAALTGQRLAVTAPNPRGGAAGVERLDGRRRRPRRSAWAVLAGERREAVQFGGPILRVIPAARLSRDPQLARLGPDLLAPDPDLDAVVGSLRTDPTRTLDDADLRAVLIAARSLMQEAVATGRHTYAVYRARRPCPSWGGRIASRGQGDANRTTYWCPRCQGSTFELGRP